MTAIETPTHLLIYSAVHKSMQGKAKLLYSVN